VVPYLLLAVPQVVHRVVVAPVIDVRVVVHAAGPKAKALLEAELRGAALLDHPEVPLAEDARAVATRTQLRGQGGLRRQPVRAAGAAQDRLDAGVSRVASGEQRGARGRAHGGIRVPLRQADPARSEL